MQIQIKRIYETPDLSDGFRILVDRLWPRGVKKEGAALDVWAKELAPTTELRKWFDHQESKFEKFRLCYLAELKTNSHQVEEVMKQAGDRPVTLLFAARNPRCNHAIVLQEYLQS